MNDVLKYYASCCGAVIVSFLGLLSLPFIVPGCHSYEEVSRAEWMSLPSDREEIEVVAIDGSSAELGERLYVFTNAADTSTIVAINAGREMRTGHRQVWSFRGFVRPIRIDTVRATPGSAAAGSSSADSYDFWISDTVKVRALAKDATFLSAGTGAIMWYMNDGRGGHVPVEDIESIGVSRISVVKTVMLTIAIVPAVAAIIGGIIMQGSFLD